MAAELLGLAAAYNNEIIVPEMVAIALGRYIQRDAYLDSKTVFDMITNISATLKKRLQIDANSPQEAHRTGKLAALHWIPSA